MGAPVASHIQYSRSWWLTMVCYDALKTLFVCLFVCAMMMCDLQADTSLNQACGLITKIDPVSPLRRITDTYPGNTPIPKTKCNPTYGMDKNQQVPKNYVAEFDIGGARLALVGIHLVAMVGRIHQFKCLRLYL